MSGWNFLVVEMGNLQGSRRSPGSFWGPLAINWTLSSHGVILKNIFKNLFKIPQCINIRATPV